MNFYYCIKDAEVSFSWMEAEWLTPYEVLAMFVQQEFEAVHPHEIILNESNSAPVDALLLAKYKNSNGNIKLKSILLSQLQLQCSSNSGKNLLILRLPKESYYWCQVQNANIIPKYALRAGYDQMTRQFSYIGRMRIANVSPTASTTSSNLKHISNTITNLIGSLTHFYEYIPAIVLQLHDLSYLDERKLIQFNSTGSQTNSSDKNQTESFWSKLRAAIKNKSSKDMDFNFISNNYEVLCLRRQPATLKTLCCLVLYKIDEQFDEENKNPVCHIYETLKTLPNSIRNLLWPCYLMPGQCVVKSGKMRSSNDLYEININKFGSLRFIKHGEIRKQTVTYEKNVESMLVSQSGVYLIYDSYQAMRKPTVLYKHKPIKQIVSCSLVDTQVSNKSTNLLDNSLGSSFIFELSDTGHLRVIVQSFVSSTNKCVKSRAVIMNLINLNEFFRTSEDLSSDSTSNLLSNKTTTSSGFINTNIAAEQDASLVLSVQIFLNDFVRFPQRLLRSLMIIIKTAFQRMRNSLPAQSLIS